MRNAGFTTIGAALFLTLLAGPSHAIAFARVDRNEDGFVTSEEAYRYMNGMQDVQLRKCDRNRDGVIERSEFGCLASIYDVTLRDTRE